MTPKHRKILLLGQNPSHDKQSGAFFDTRSWNTLSGWLSLAGVGLENVDTDNVFYNVGKVAILPSKERRRELMDLLSNYGAVVAVGSTAARALTVAAREATDQAGLLKFFSIPHPSGRNRNLNDPKNVDAAVEVLRQASVLTSTRTKADV